MSLSNFFKQNLDYVIVFYGLSFLLMFLVLFVQRRKAAHFELLNSFKLLSAFALFHGIADIMVVFPSYFSFSENEQAVFLISKFIMFVASFQFLLHFGLSVVVRERERRRRFMIIFLPYLALVYAFSASRILSDTTTAILVARLFLNLPANLLAFLAFLRLYSEARKLNLSGLERSFFGAAIGFLSYGFFAGAVTASYPNTADIFGIPTQVFRAFSAVAITLFVVRILLVFEVRPVERYHLKEITR